MKKINLLFGIHCHQPVGNFDHVFDQAFNDCYLPFIQTMERHPKIKFAVHYSGILYDWFLKHHPEYLELIAKLVRLGQVEVMTAGYYEPIIPIIPDEDKIGQIKMQSEFIKKHFKASPQGMWLTERIWEPSLPSALKAADIDYLTVDDYHFISAGAPKDKLFGYYITEDQGNILKVFPINKEMRYSVPFKLPQETIKYLSEIATEDGRSAAILADDGEKFGLWPGTHKWVYEDGYLENLLAEIEANLSWIKPMTFSEYIEEYPPVGRVYLPTASYFEMMQWVLPAEAGIRLERLIKEAEHSGRGDEYKEFFKGGFFRNFFVKYSESNNMHKKMLHVSQKLSTLKKTTSDHPKQEREKLLAEAEKHLYMGQCNCAYWHGVFGGLYLSNLRNAVYEHLIQAENILQALSRGDKKYTELTISDIDRDGHEEVLLSNPYLNLCFSPNNGGSLFELDYKSKAFNLLNVLTRRREAYHEKIIRCKLAASGVEPGHESIHDAMTSKEEGIEKYLVYDKAPRLSLVDHFFDSSENVDSFKFLNYKELGDFLSNPYSFFPLRKKDEVGLSMTRLGAVNGKPIRLAKSISLLSGQSIFSVDYEILNQSPDILEIEFGIEFNVTLLAKDAPDRYFKISGSNLENSKLNSEGIVPKIKEVKLVDDWKGFGVSFESQHDAKFIRYPIETVSQSEGGYERNYQGSCMIFVYKLSLLPKETWKNKLVIRFES